MKLRNKLILSCAALAAVATTAVSTTFAWYTSNTEVHADSINATTKNAGADLLMIADGLAYNSSTKAYTLKADTDLVWGTTITPTQNAQDLLPLAFTRANTGTASNTQGYIAELGTKTTGEGTSAVTTSITNTAATADGSGFLNFVLMVKNASTAEKGLQMTISDLTNTTYKTGTTTLALPSKAILNPTDNAKYMGLGTSATNYTVNALRVAAIDLEISKVTDGAIASAALQDEGVYSLRSALSADESANAISFGDTVVPTGANYSAHSYYNAIMETDLDIADTLNVDTTSFRNLGAADGVKLLINTPAGATANDYLMLNFKVFLNGWDKSCFDACQGQTFTFNVDFEAVAAN